MDVKVVTGLIYPLNRLSLPVPSSLGCYSKKKQFDWVDQKGGCLGDPDKNTYAPNLKSCKGKCEKEDEFLCRYKVQCIVVCIDTVTTTLNCITTQNNQTTEKSQT